MAEPDPLFLTSREAARLLRIGRTKLWELTRDGEVPAYRVGSGRTSPLRYKRAELIRWLERHRIDPATEPAAVPPAVSGPRGIAPDGAR
jgi:excisionase family DNA binding protein